MLHWNSSLVITSSTVRTSIHYPSYMQLLAINTLGLGYLLRASNEVLHTNCDSEKKSSGHVYWIPYLLPYTVRVYGVRVCVFQKLERCCCDNQSAYPAPIWPLVSSGMYNIDCYILRTRYVLPGTWCQIVMLYVPLQSFTWNDKMPNSEMRWKNRAAWYTSKNVWEAWAPAAGADRAQS